METLSVILAQLQSGDWASSIDLADAYLHIPVHQDSSLFLCSRFDGVSYRFTALPFGLSTAPRSFTRVTRAMVACLRRQGVRIFTYLDDWLIVGRSREETIRSTQATLRLADELGWLVNQVKSELTPSQRVTYLGAEMDLVQDLVFPTRERVESLTSGVLLVQRHFPLPARAWLVLLGFMAKLGSEARRYWFAATAQQQWRTSIVRAARAQCAFGQ